MSLLGLPSWGLSERNVPFTCFCSECCMQRGPGRSVSWVYEEGIKWGTIHTLPPKMPRALLWGAEESKEKQRGEKMKGWILGSHMKVEGCCVCTRTELRKEWGKSLSLLTEILSVTWREAVLFVLFLLWCQLQCQPQHPTVQVPHQVKCFSHQCPWLGPVLGLYPRQSRWWRFHTLTQRTWRRHVPQCLLNTHEKRTPSSRNFYREYHLEFSTAMGKCPRVCDQNTLSSVYFTNGKVSYLNTSNWTLCIFCRFL